MAVVTKTVTTIDVCECCKKKNELSPQDLKKPESSILGGTRYFKYTCKHCGEINYVYFREISIHVLRQLQEV